MITNTNVCNDFFFRILHVSLILNIELRNLLLWCECQQRRRKQRRRQQRRNQQRKKQKRKNANQSV
jgi:hypothetical protein